MSRRRVDHVAMAKDLATLDIICEFQRTILRSFERLNDKEISVRMVSAAKEGGIEAVRGELERVRDELHKTIAEVLAKVQSRASEGVNSPPPKKISKPH
jgi:hypothetical protein